MSKMTKAEALEKYKAHLKEGPDYMGVARQVLEKLETDTLFAFVVSGLCQEIYEREAKADG